MRAILDFDGASKGNPGPGGWGYVLYLEDGRHIEGHGGCDMATNNQMEYRGLIEGLKKALELGVKELKVKGDSQLVIMQMKGVYKVKNPNIKPLYEEAKRYEHFMKVDYLHIPREKNRRADKLANIGAKGG